MLKKILLLIPCLVVLLIIFRVIMIRIKQKREFAYHNDIPLSIRLRSDDFDHNGMMPEKSTGLGENASPSLYWDNLPEGTKSLAIIAVDYDAPSPWIKLMTVDHWVVFNIPLHVNNLEGSLTSSNLSDLGISSGKNITGKTGYIGPNPPFGTHRYYFRVYALSVPKIDLEKPSKGELMDNMKNSILAYGELIGKFSK